jgi:nucleoside-diphosphate-sugar epimerase
MGTKKGDGRVLNQLIEKALINKEIALIDEGLAMRQYCYITDTVEMLFNILLHGKEKCYNIAGVSHTSIMGLAFQIGRKLKIGVRQGEKSLDGSPKLVSVSIDKYKKEFKKKKFVSLSDGLDRVIEYQKLLYA